MKLKLPSDMKPIAERVRSLLYYAAHEAKEPFTWQSWMKAIPGSNSIVNTDGFLEINIWPANDIYGGTFYRADELAWLIMTGEWPEHVICHADGEKLNNSWDNIKEKASLPKVA